MIKNNYYQFDREKLESLKELYRKKKISKLKKLCLLFISYIQNALVTRSS